ncbi:MAG: EAL domain-containing protein [Rhodoferax sp.]|nr:EAL domain-containing protein [Rhodoferax sp.]
MGIERLKQRLGSISAKVRLLVLISVLPAVAVVLHQAQTNRDTAIANARARAMETSRALAANQQLLIDNTQQFLQKLAGAPMALRPDDPACGKFLADVLSLNTIFVNLGLPQTDGNLLCNARPLTSKVNVADRPYFQRAIQLREFSIGQFQLDRAANVASVNFAYPVINPVTHEVVAAAVAVVSLDWWSRRLADLGLPPGAIARVCDPNGKVLARFPSEPAEIGAGVATLDLAFVHERQGEVGALSWRDRHGARQLVAFMPLLASDGKPGATMSLVVPLETLYATADQQMWRDIGFLLAGLLVSLALAQVGIRSVVTQPLKKLLDATDRLSKGEFGANVPVSGAGDLVELSRRFNGMALTRQAAEAQLRLSEENLAITLYSIGDAVIATDIAGLVTRMNAAAERMTGWPLALALGRPLPDVFHIVNSQTRAPVINPVQLVIERGEIVGLANHTALIARDGRQYQISDSAAPIRDPAGQIVGVVLVFSDVTEKYRAQTALHESEARNQALISAIPDAIFTSQRDGKYLAVQAPDPAVLFAPPETLLQRTVQEVLPKPIADMFLAAFGRALDSGTMQEVNYSLPIGAQQRHFEARVVPSTEGIVISIVRDITERKQSEEALRIAATAFESQEGIMVTDAASVILRVNRAFTEITGYSAEEAVGQTPRLLRSDRHDAAFYAAMWECTTRTGTWRDEIWNRRKNGEVYPEWLTITAVKDELGRVTHYVATFTDISVRKTAEEQIRSLAFYDPLTALPNRRLLMDRLDQALAVCGRRQRRCALLFVDLDSFKSVNDTLGHYQGDLLLEQVARRLTTCVREGDTVARLGGDEFVVMLEDLSESPTEAAAQAEAIAEKILIALNQTYQLGSHECRSSASIGISLLGDQRESADELLRRADLAMYQAKAVGRNTLRFFDPQMQVVVIARAAMEADLRESILKDQLLLYYQAQVVDEGCVTGAEALVRWQHPQRGMVLPAEFIPLAEETGLIVPLGNWVLKTACAQLAAWAARPELAHLTVAVNVSSHQFRQADFVDQVLTVLKNSGANPQRLKLELTESLLISNVTDVIDKMSVLKANGVGFSLDDFGTGYSSLAYLKRLPLDQLKIDQSFVRDVMTNPHDVSIVKTIVALAQNLGLGVIAEGVETDTQREFLANSGCHAFQGYLFSRPLPREEFEGVAGRSMILAR